MAELEAVGVVGAGFMGLGIAESAARAGLRVKHEPDAAPLDRSRGRIEASVGRAVEGGKLTAEEAGALVERIEWTTDPDGLADAGVVIEAVIEDASLKGSVFQTLDRSLGEDVILASNTSSIPIASSPPGPTTRSACSACTSSPRCR